MDKRLQALMGTCEKLPTDNLNNFRLPQTLTAVLFIYYLLFIFPFRAIFFGHRPFSLITINEHNKDEEEGDFGVNPAGIWSNS